MVVQRVDHPEPAAANKLALEDLENGAGGLSIVFAGAPSARGFGLDARTLDDLDHALAGVMLDIVSLRIETAPFLGRMVAALIAALVERRGLTPAALDIDFGLDPVGDIARTGGASLPWLALSVRAAEVATALAERGFTRSLLRVDTRGIHEAGGWRRRNSRPRFRPVSLICACSKRRAGPRRRTERDLVPDGC